MIKVGNLPSGRFIRAWCHRGGMFFSVSFAHQWWFKVYFDPTALIIRLGGTWPGNFIEIGDF